jgi:hypothetical protein
MTPMCIAPVAFLRKGASIMNRIFVVSSLVLASVGFVCVSAGLAPIRPSGNRTGQVVTAASPLFQQKETDLSKIPADPEGKGATGVDTGPDNRFIQQKLVNFLQIEITTENLQGSLRLDEFLEQLNATVEKQHKLELPLLVDSAAFRSENPDAPPVYDAYIAIPSIPKKMAIITVLRLAMTQIPTQNATFLIRRGQVVITTHSAASIRHLLQENVTVAFVNAPLPDALTVIGYHTGLSITLDQASIVKEKLKLPPVSATFANNVSAESALATLAELTGLKMLVLGDVVYITTPERAGDLFLLERELKNRPSFPAGVKYLGTGG